MEAILLIVITRFHALPGDTGRDLPDEFVAYWGGNKDTEYLEFTDKNNQHKVKVINGPLFYAQAKKNQFWKNADPNCKAEIFFEKIKHLFPQAPQKFGVIIHQNIPVDKVINNKMRTQIIFCKKHSSTNGNIYKEVYIPLAKSCSKSNIIDVGLLEELWTSFLGDPELEAKLDLLHALLVIPASFNDIENENGLWTKLKNIIADESKKNKYDRVWKTFKDNCNNRKFSGPFDNDYIKCLSELRDNLEINKS